MNQKLLFSIYLFCLFKLSVNLVQITSILEDQAYISNLFIAKSPLNETHLFYSYYNTYLLKLKDDENFISRINLKKYIENRVYFNSNNEYLDFNGLDKLSYYKDYNIIKLFSNNKIKIKIADFVILKDKSIIITSKEEKDSIFYLKLFYFKYPPNKAPLHYYENDKIILSLNDKINIIDNSNMIFVFNYNPDKKGIFLYIFDIKIKELYLQKVIEEEGNFPIIKTEYLDKNRNNIMICASKYIGDVECYSIEYKGELIIGNKLQIFPKCEWYNKDNLYMTLIEDNKIAVVCANQYDIFYSIIQFDKGNLKFGKYKNMKLPLNNENKFFFNNPVLILNQEQNKKLSLYFTISDHFTFTEKIAKIDLNKYCNSFIMKDVEPNKKILINFKNNISRLIEENNDTLSITYADKEIEIYKYNEKLPVNAEFYIDDKIFIQCEDSLKPLILYYKYEDSICQIQINLKKIYISIIDEKYRCLLTKDYKEPNNILYHELNDKKFDINDKQFNFNIIFEKKVGQYNFNFYFLDDELNCEKNKKNERMLLCKGYIPTVVSNIYEKDLNIYSNLYCTNKIKIGTVKIRDKYLKEIYSIKDLATITQRVNSKYNPEERIKYFSVDMISYYYWFSAISYCDDEMIAKNQCCREEILDDWEVIKHKEYKLSLIERIAHFLFSKYMEGFYKRIKKYLEMLQSYVYNFVILKSKKYKKFIFAFPGTTGAKQLLFEILGSSFSIFDAKEPNIKVENFFYDTFLLIYQDLFSDEIINELKANSGYQIIFTGHSLGGAIATLSSYYYAKNKLSKNEPVLITFGQPRVGNVDFAKRYMELIPLVFRVARKGDVVTIIPPDKKLKELKFFGFFHTLKYQMKAMGKEIKNLSKYNFIQKIGKSLQLLLKFILAVLHILFTLIMRLIFQLPIFPYGYCHIGGLYLLTDDTFYECSDFYNEETGHPICNNWEYDTIYDIKNIFDNHGYIKFGDSLLGKCQKGKGFWPF